MRRIIITKWNRRVCPYCGTLFEFDDKDIHDRVITIFEETNSYTRYEVNCPCCETSIFLCDEENVVDNTDGLFSDYFMIQQKKFFERNHDEVLQDILDRKYDYVLGKRE